MKQTVALALLSLLVALGCSYRIERDPTELVVALPLDPVTLNPLLSREAAGGEVLQWIYEPLCRYDRDTLELAPQLATAWEISDDGRRFIFSLRPDVRWHDGVAFTADDVVFAFEQIRNPNADAAPRRAAYRDVESVEKIDDHTVRAVIREPYFRALTILCSLTPIPRHVFGKAANFNAHPANRAPIGTGPFRFELWKTGERVVLSRNDAYWGARPEISAIVYKIIPDATVSFQNLKKGGIDRAPLQPLEWTRQTAGERFLRRFRKHQYYLPNASYIAWNMRRPLFADRRVRQAMTMFLNRRAMLEKQLFGLGEMLSADFYRFGPFYDLSIAPLEYDPLAATRLLEEAGWVDRDGDGIRDRDGQSFRFQFLFRSGDVLARTVGLLLRDELRRAGIDMTLLQFEWGAMLKLVEERAFDAVCLGWAFAPDNDPYGQWHSTQVDTGLNLAGFRDPRADRLLEMGRREFDVSKRQALYHELHQLLHDEQPSTFLFIRPTLVAISSRFEAVTVHRFGLDPLEWKVGIGEPLFSW